MENVLVQRKKVSQQNLQFFFVEFKMYENCQRNKSSFIELMPINTRDIFY